MRKHTYIWVLLYFIFLPGNLSSQIEDITRLPVQDPSRSIKESAPVWISENEMMIFHVSPTLDTIYSAISSDRGTSWDGPNVIQTVVPYNQQNELYLSAIRSSTGRIILAWSIRAEGMNLIYSDDNGDI